MRRGVTTVYASVSVMYTRCGRLTDHYTTAYRVGPPAFPLTGEWFRPSCCTLQRRAYMWTAERVDAHAYVTRCCVVCTCVKFGR